VAKKVLLEGSKAIAKSAVQAGCRFYASYPIQPNTHLIEAMAQELAKVGGVHMNAESEGEAINMAWGAAVTGARTMCSSTVTGMSLMHEAMSEMFAAEVPYVFVHMSRGQTEYRVGTRGGGHGEYRYVSFAPHTVQEAADLIKRAFYTADKYRTPVLVQSDYVLCHTVEAVEFKPFDESDLPEVKTWAITGAKGRRPRVNSFIRGTYSLGEKSHVSYGELQERSVDRIAYLEKHVPALAETSHHTDSDLVIMSFGYASRFAKYAVNELRNEGMSVGYIRPITMWPFPKKEVLEAAQRAKAIAVFELNNGQMLDDVRLTVLGKTPVHFIGRISQDDSGFGMGEAIQIPNLMAKIRETFDSLRTPVRA
jgi:2-oxoglutarate ferredoxin oxidoreductase subunit alpha